MIVECGRRRAAQDTEEQKKNISRYVSITSMKPIHILRYVSITSIDFFFNTTIHIFIRNHCGYSLTICFEILFTVPFCSKSTKPLCKS